MKYIAIISVILTCITNLAYAGDGVFPRKPGYAAGGIGAGILEAKDSDSGFYEPSGVLHLGFGYKENDYIGFEGNFHLITGSRSLGKGSCLTTINANIDCDLNLKVSVFGVGVGARAFYPVDSVIPTAKIAFVRNSITETLYATAKEVSDQKEKGSSYSHETVLSVGVIFKKRHMIEYKNFGEIGGKDADTQQYSYSSLNYIFIIGEI